MSFLYPWMFWALLALAIPIAVHLFNFRRHKQVYFSNTALLKTIQQENAKTKKLKYLVALALRCLLIVALVLAFAFPFKPEAAANIDTEEGVVGIYLDNSMSMKAQSTKTTLLEDARESARHLVERFSPSTRYLLLTNSFEIQNEYPMNQEEMLQQLDRMAMEGNPMRLNQVVERFEMLKKRHGFEQATLIAYSDFQKNMFDAPVDGSGQSPKPLDTSLRVIAVPVSAEVSSNLSIDTVWLSSPVMQVGIANEIHAVVSNHGEKAVKGLPVNLSMDGKVTASTSVDVEGNATSELVMQFLLQSPGATRCALTLMDYPITFDDSYDFVIETRPSLKVVDLIRNNSVSYTSMVFGEDPQYAFSKMDPSGVDLQELAKAQLIVVSETSSLNETLRQTLLDDASEGACVVLFHDDGRTVDTNQMAVGSVAVQHEFFSDIILDLPQHADLPRVRRHVALRPKADESVLMLLDNGEPFLVQKAVGKGFVFDVATTLDEQWSNLADHSLFVPLMLKMALMGGGVGKLSYTLGEDKTLVFNDLNTEGDLQIVFRNEEGTFEMMPSRDVRNNRVCLFIQDDFPAAGFYDLVMQDSVCHVLAWNDSRTESELQFADKAQIVKAFENAGLEVMAVLNPDEFAHHDLVEAMAKKSSLWKWFVLLALLALAGEIAVLRFWK